eukprot:TRINITY_DN407_c0_g2_i1.p1 TRINITY_DN407_c0_g2~~TRINITY_DN407_c0_g2_i1.p1  ORF type:complete len:820 (+),score=59.91 TRINITY_DN407_c0_g2_i1:454-2913(+)
MHVLLGALSDIEGATSYNYADDIGVTAPDAGVLQRATDVVANYAADTGQELNTRKTQSFSLKNRNPGVKVNGDLIQFVSDFNHLGVGHVTGKRRASRYTDNRLADGRRRARGIAKLPLPFQEKTRLIEAQVIPSALYGAFATHHTATSLCHLERDILTAIWWRRKRRCKEVVLNLLSRGHKVDPRSVIPFASVMTLVTEYARNPAVRETIRSLFRTNNSHHGPVAAVQVHLRAVGWGWRAEDDGMFLTTHSGTTHRLKDADAGKLAHDLRDALRLTAWRAAEAHRTSMAGIADGVDIHLTNHGWRARGGKYTYHEAGILRAIIAGAIQNCAQAQHTLGFAETPVCTHCDAEVTDTHMHMWWDCAAHANVRAGYADIIQMDRSGWPPAVLINAIAPTSWLQTSKRAERLRCIGRIQRMMVDIVNDRNTLQGKRERPAQPPITMSHRAQRQDDFPWGWEPPAPVQRYQIDAIRWTKKKFARRQWVTEQLMQNFKRWWALLQWPAEGTRTPGVSMLELMIDFELHSGHTIPGEGAEGSRTKLQMFVNLVAVAGELMPKGGKWHSGQRHRLPVLRMGGTGPKWVSGFTARPKLAKQSETESVLRVLMRRHSNKDTDKISRRRPDAVGNSAGEQQKAHWLNGIAVAACRQEALAGAPLPDPHPAQEDRRGATSHDIPLKGYFDGASKGNCGPSGAGGVLLENGKQIDTFAVPLDDCSNNVAEYEALIELLSMVAARKRLPRRVELVGDSELVIMQMKRLWLVRDEYLQQLFAQAKHLEGDLLSRNCQPYYTYVPRDKNVAADAQANLAVEIAERTRPRRPETPV